MKVHGIIFIADDDDDESLHLHLSASVDEEDDNQIDSDKIQYMRNMGLSPCIQNELSGDVSKDECTDVATAAKCTPTPWLWQAFTRSEMKKLKERDGK